MLDGVVLRLHPPGSRIPWHPSAWAVVPTSRWSGGATTAGPAAGSSVEKALLTRYLGSKQK